MFGLWSSKLRAMRPDEVSDEYICSTLVAAAFYYSGIELDAIDRRALEILTPQEVVASRGRVVATADVEIRAESVSSD